MSKLDDQVTTFFIEQGWVPPTAEQYEAEIRRKMESGLTRSEAECVVNEAIRKDLEQFVQMEFADFPSVMC